MQFTQKKDCFLLFQVTYNIYHTAGIIKQVQLDFTLDDFSNTTMEIYQTYSVRYQEWNTSNADVFSRSGNPGYIIGIYDHFNLFKVQVICRGSVVNDKTYICYWCVYFHCTINFNGQTTLTSKIDQPSSSFSALSWSVYGQECLKSRQAISLDTRYDAFSV